MDWPTLIADNFDNLLVIISTLLGGVLGGGITYLVQSGLQDRQRKWQLDDRSREWKREQLISIQKKLKMIASDYLEVSNFGDARAWSQDEMMKMRKSISNLITDADALLLYPAVFEYFFKTWYPDLYELSRSNPEDPELKGKASIFSYTNFGLQRRINALIEETYGPPPSRFQRLVNWLTPNRNH